MYDLVVIGSGPAGEKAAALAAYFGKRVAMVERNRRPGGAPVNTGGIPSKTLREAALYLNDHRSRDVYGVGLALNSELALERIRTRAAEVSTVVGGSVRRNLSRHGIELLIGEASLQPDRTVTLRQAGGRHQALKGEVVLIATGSRPFHPPGIPFDDPDVHDSDTILDLDASPKSLAVVGAGPVGCEYASIFASLGVKVSLIDTNLRILRHFDAEVSAGLEEAFVEIGMDLLLGWPKAQIARRRGSVVVTAASGEVVEPHKVLFAGGRVGNVKGLRLAESGVEVDERGRIVVDEHFRTTAERVYAAGDVTGAPLASISAEQGRIAACHAFEVPFDLTLDWLPPSAVYTTPEVAMVGMTEEEAEEEEINYAVGRARFIDNPRSQLAATTRGFLKLLVRRDDRRLVGVHVVGEGAAELVHIGQAAMHCDATIDHFVQTTFNVPTRSEVYKYAAYDALQDLIGRRLPTATVPTASMSHG
ncbi:MAG TPA: Si-specific NAD(P)(+) transhydrogenase [Acidimicrobiia bacterium]